MGTLFGTKGRAVEFMLAPLTKAGVVTGVVVELILTIAELWNVTEGTFSRAWSLGCTPGEMGVEGSLTLTSGGGKRRGLGPRNDVLTTCKAVTLRGGQRIIALFPTVNIFRLFRSRKRTGRGNQKCLKN